MVKKLMKFSGIGVWKYEIIVWSNVASYSRWKEHYKRQYVGAAPIQLIYWRSLGHA